MTGHYDNFDDPLGLLWRMVTSRDSSAWATLARAGIRPLMSPLDRRWQSENDRLIGEAEPSDRPLLLVSGGARCGTSLTAQVLARRLRTSWFDNYTDLFPRSPLVAFARRSSDHHRVELASYYGNTRRFGDLSDAFSVWNRWLGADRYQPEISDEDAERMRRFFDAFDAIAPYPLLNKNNRNLAIVSALAAALPRARFVIVTRDPMANVASLLKARAVVHGDVRKPWGVFSTNDRADADELGYVDDVCAQVIAVTEAARAAHAELGDRVALVDFEKVLANPHHMAEAIGAQHGLDVRTDPVDVELDAARSGQKMAPAEHDRAREVLAAAELV